MMRFGESNTLLLSDCFRQSIKIWMSVCQFIVFTGMGLAMPVPEVHLDASVGVTEATGVSVWENQGSAAGLNAIQTSGADQPEYEV